LNDRRQSFKEKKKKIKRVILSYKFENVGLTAFKSMIAHYPDIMPNEEETKLANCALDDKGLNVYLKAIESDLLNCRYLFGFCKKRSSGKIKYFNPRWMFLISARPLNYSSYL